METTIKFITDDEQLKKSEKTIRELNKEYKKLHQNVQQHQQYLERYELYKNDVPLYRSSPMNIKSEETRQAAQNVDNLAKQLSKTKLPEEDKMEEIILWILGMAKFAPGVGKVAGLAKEAIEAKREAEGRDISRKKAKELQAQEQEKNFQDITEGTEKRAEQFKNPLGEAYRKIIEGEKQVVEAQIDALEQTIAVQQKKRKDVILNDLTYTTEQQKAFENQALIATNQPIEGNQLQLQGLQKKYYSLGFALGLANSNTNSTASANGKSVDSRTLPTVEVNPLPLKKAGDVVGLINTQMQAAKFATVELGKSFQQTGQQGGKSFIELINFSGKLKTTLASGLDVVSQKIQQGVHNKLVEAFNGAHSVAQQFFADVLSQLAAVAAKAGSGAIIAGLLSVIPGVGTFAGLFKSLTGFASGGVIPEPVLGIGLRSGTGYTFGEQGPEYVTPNNQLQSARFSTIGSNQLAQRIAGLEKAIAGGTWRISGRDIVYSYDRNSYGVNQRRF